MVQQREAAFVNCCFVNNLHSVKPDRVVRTVVPGSIRHERVPENLLLKKHMNIIFRVYVGAPPLDQLQYVLAYSKV